MTRAPDRPLPKWGRVQAMRGRRPPTGSAALPVSSPSQMGRGTVRSLAEAKEGGGAPAARLLPASRGGGPRVAWWRGAGRTLLPTPPPSFGWSPSPFAARTGRRRDAHNPPIVSIFRAANPLISRVFQKLQRHKPSAPGPVPDSCPSRRWGGRRIQRPDVGGLWSSDEARGKDTSGVLAQVDGWPAPARRALPVRAAVSCPPRVDARKGDGAIR